MAFAGNSHASDETLESYVLRRLPSGERAKLEEHLFVCDSCRQRLAEEAEFRLGVRDHFAHPERTSRRFPKAALIAAWAALALLVLGGLAWKILQGSGGVPATILLQATRGPGEGNPAAPAGHALILELDLSGLPAAPFYTGEIVDSRGTTVFQSRLKVDSSHARIHVPGGLPAGVYFVRLYSGSRELLREFALSVAK